MPKRLEGDFDYIVVGAGTAGCIMANRLSADPKNRVLILEAGGNDNWIWFHIPVGYLFAIGNPRSDWMFKTEPEPGLNGRALAYPRGKVIGGSSAINAMISMRGQAADYDHWRQLGLTGWGYDDVLPLFKRLEDHFLGESEHHGTGGGWRIEAPRLSWDVLDAVGDAAEEMGIKRIADFNTGDNEGTSYFHVNQKRGRRWSSARGFLKPVLNRGQSAAGKERAGRPAHHRERPRRRRALHAGRRSGRGPHQGRSHSVRRLDRIDAGAAPVRHRALPTGCRRSASTSCSTSQGVGRNLQDHLQQRAIYKVEGVRTLNETYYNPDPARPDGARLCLPPPRAADHGAVAARHLHPLRSAPRARQHPVPRAAAVARQVRRSPASFSRDHRQRLQSAADLARHRAHPLGEARRGAVDRAELSLDRRRPPGRGRRHPHHAAADEAEAARNDIIRRNICPAPASATTTPRWQKPPAISAPRSSIPSGPRRWARQAIRLPWSTSACASTASRACASPMRR